MAEETRIQKANPALRKKALIAVIGTAVLVGLVLFFFEGKLTDFMTNNAGQFVESPGKFALVFAVFMLPLVIAAVHMFLYGRKVVTAQRFPPPDTEVVRDTRILTATQAVGRGKSLIFFAIILIIIAIAVPSMIWLMLRSIFETF